MIGFLDSGIGGISVLNACREALGKEKFVYLCDSKNAPYGSKTKKQVEKIAVKNVKTLIRQGAKTIVIACNTATICAAKKLRKKFPKIQFIGTEPNVNEPVKKGFKKIAVLCTPASAKHSQILKKFENKIDVICPYNLATKIENGSLEIEGLFAGVQCDDYDAVVIGCTHFSFVEDKLKKLFKNAKFFDSRLGVAKRLKYVLALPKIVCTGKKNLKQKKQQIEKLINFNNC